MVAFTSAYLLPYQQGTDKPCFGPGTGCDNLVSVWCDFAQLVEAQLVDFDNIVGRTFDAIPMAKIRYKSPAGTTHTGNDIPFDTVVFDTDGMVDLSSINGITPRRNGVYAINLYLNGNYTVPSTLDDEEVEAFISVGAETTPTWFLSVTPAVSLASNIIDDFLPDTDVTMRASTFYRFTSTSPNPRAVTATFEAVSEPSFINIAELEMYWHGD